MRTNFYILLVCLFLQYSNSINSQWVKTNGLTVTTVNCLTSASSNLFAGTTLQGAFFTTNNGANWVSGNSGLPSNRSVLAFLVSGNNLLAGLSQGGVFITTNNGSNWNPVNDGLNGNSVYTFAAMGTNIFVGTFGGVYLSTNIGSNWVPVNSGLTNLNLRSLVVSGTNLFAGTYFSGGVYVTTNSGAIWIEVNNGLAFRDVLALGVSGSNLFAGTSGGGIYSTTNNGLNWSAANFGLPPNVSVSSIVAYGVNIFAGTVGYGVFLSTNNGANWTAINTGLPSNTSAYSLHVLGENIYTGTFENGVWRRPISDIISVQNISNEVPTLSMLKQNYPNPFNPKTKIQYQISDYGLVKLIVYDILGRKIAALVDEDLQAGTYEVNFEGNGYPSGIYFYTLVTKGYSNTKRMLMIK